MNKLKFSIIVPVFNVEQHLERCVFSLRNQRNMSGELEILLINDGSTDKSGILCDQLAERFPQIRVFHKKNGGLSSARNLGIEKAEGDYVLFADSDDFIEQKTCSIINEALKKYGKVDALCFAGVEDYGTKQVPMRRIPLKKVKCSKTGKLFLLEHYKQRNLNVEACLYAYRREFLLENNLRFLEGILHEDVEFTPRALLKCGKIVEIPDCLYHYMIREGSISTQKNKEKNIRDLFSTLNRQIKVAERQEPELKKWMKNEALNSYLNMVYEARMYQPQYRGLLDKRFLFGKAATNWNRFRVVICFLNVRLYCWMNDCYKKCVFHKPYTKK